MLDVFELISNKLFTSIGNNLISISETKAFFISATKNRKYSDAYRFAKNHYFNIFQKWRWKHGIVIRKNVKVPIPNNKSVSGYIKIDDFKKDTCRVILNCKKYFKSTLPESMQNSNMFRAAGGKRLPWPENHSIYDFEDIQDKHAWHRLYWILDTNIEIIPKYLNNWFIGELNEVLIHPYTTSERICNLVEFIGTSTISEDLQNKIVTQIYKDANWLYNNIETHLGTHNHLLNNARALCRASYAFKGNNSSKIWLNRAREIWFEYWPKLINDDGFFIDNSSFYHVLMTRTFIDFIKDAKLSDLHIPKKLLNKGIKMCRITNILFRSDGTIPKFGDNSPDVPIEWLRGLPNICKKLDLLNEEVRDNNNGYAGGASTAYKIFSELSSENNTQKRIVNDWSYDLFKKSGFLFSRNEKINLELTAMGFWNERLNDHGDTGVGSYEIWWDGKPIVVDGGIPEYGLSEKAKIFQSPKGQNTITLDGIAPTLTSREKAIFPKWYLKSLGKSKWSWENEKVIFEWLGFERYKPGLIWQRGWKWNNNQLKITDKIFGIDDKIMFNSFLHFGDKNWTKINDDSFKNNNCVLIMNSNKYVEKHLSDMPYSSNYGIIKNSKGIILEGDIQLPFEIELTFIFN